MEWVRFWTDMALEANRIAHTEGGEQTGPFRSARALGMTLIAMHDAWFAGHHGVAPYHAHQAPEAGATPAGSLAAAAEWMLNKLYPTQAATFTEALDYQHRASPINHASRNTGRAVARQVFDWRQPDESQGLLRNLANVAAYREAGFTTDPYDHSADPRSPGQDFAGPFWGHAPLFLITSRPYAMPPGATAEGGFTPTPHYLQELDDVKSLGRDISMHRTSDQEEIGIFWAYDGPKGIGTPPRLYIQVALTVLDGIRGRPSTWLDEAKALEALTATAVAMADAGIEAWRYKYSQGHNLWRPILGVTRAEHAPGAAEPGWTPIGRPDTNGGKTGVTPGFPAYPSGHATFGAAAFDVLRRFIRKHDPSHQFTDDAPDNIAFVFVSDEFDGRNVDPRTKRPRPRKSRYFTSLWQAIIENSVSRVYLGVHWRMDGVSRLAPGGNSIFGTPDTPGELGLYGGVRLGMDIAREVATKRGF